jgi:hypothetical protein
VLNLDQRGHPLSYTPAIAGLNQADWPTADIKELFKLMIDTRTLKPLLKPLKKPTHYNRVVKEKWNAVTKSIDRRVRGAAGGDRLSCNYDISSSSVASLVTVKILLNDVSSENKLFATIGLADFYLGADLPEPEYIGIYIGEPGGGPTQFKGSRKGRRRWPRAVAARKKCASAAHGGSKAQRRQGGKWRRQQLSLCSFHWGKHAQRKKHL